MTINERQPFMEEDLFLKISFLGRWPFMEDDLRWETNIDGKQHSNLNVTKNKT